MSADPLKRPVGADDTIPPEIEKIAQAIKATNNVVVLTGSGLNISAGLPETEIPADSNPQYTHSTKPLSLLRDQASPTTSYMAIAELFQKSLFRLSMYLSYFVISLGTLRIYKKRYNYKC